MSDRTLLLDGDVIAWKFAAAAADPIDWGNGVQTDYWSVDDCISNCRAWLDWLVDELDAQDYIFTLSDRSSRYFRHDLWPSYKGSRSGEDRPRFLEPFKDWVQEHQHCKIKANLEADDVLGILSTHPSLVPGQKVIVSTDKDMRTIPGLLWDMAHPTEVPERIDEGEADRTFFAQAMIGDSCDEYPGLPKVGPVRAQKILTEAEEEEISYWSAVVVAFTRRGLTEEDALLQCRLARILRWTDYDYKKKEPILWTPD